MKSFKDKVCVITGAGNGIGRATAKLLAQQGAHVIITDVNKVALDETKAHIDAAAGTCTPHIVDVANRDAMFELATQCEKEHGGADLILNNAGIANIAAIDELGIDDFRLVMDIDFWGVVHGTQAFLPQMMARNSGYIANVSSIFGFVGVPQQAAYNAAKFAVFGFTEAVRHDLAETDIMVTCIHPGGIDTDIARNARLPQGPDEAERREEIAQNFKKMVKSTPEQAAQTIVKGLLKGKPRILIGHDAIMVDIIRRLFPIKYDKFLRFGDKLDEANS